MISQKKHDFVKHFGKITLCNVDTVMKAEPFVRLPPVLYIKSIIIRFALILV